MKVIPESNAERAGIMQGDLLESYAGRTPDTIEALRTAIQLAAEAGEKEIPVVIYWDREKMELTNEPGFMGVEVME